MEVESMKNLRLNEICRVCLSAGKKEMRPLFADMIVDMLTECARIQVEKIEGWPDKICIQCINQVSRFHSFKRKVEKMDQTLREYIKGLTVIVEEQVPAEITFKNIELPAHHHHLASAQPYLTTTNGQVLATAFGQPLQIQSANGQLIPVQMLPNGQAQLLQIQRPTDEGCEIIVQSSGPHILDHQILQPQQQQQQQHQQTDLAQFQQTQYYDQEEDMMAQKEDQEELGEEEEIVERYIIEEIDEEELEAIEEGEKEHQGNEEYEELGTLQLDDEGEEEEEEDVDDFEAEELEEHTAATTEEKNDDDDDDDVEIVIEAGDILSVPGPSATKVARSPRSAASNLTTQKCTNHVPYPVSMAEAAGDPEDKVFMAEFISLQTSCPAPGRHVCNLCHREYKVMASLHTHMKSHSNWIKANCKKQPECEICHKKFKGPGMLKMHMKTHEERGLQCEYCKKAFQTEYHLGLHLVKHNKRTAETYKCAPCQQSFISANDLRLHNRRCLNRLTHTPTGAWGRIARAEALAKAVKLAPKPS